MLTLLLIIFALAALLLGIWSYSIDICRHETAKIFVGIISGICACATVISGIISIGMWCDLATEYALDQKIAMYQEENAEIETKIDTIVQEYMAHEKETFEHISPDSDTMVLVSLFPELKSDELVQQQMALHTKNNAEIKKLKESKIDLAKTKWMIYFGH